MRIIIRISVLSLVYTLVICILLLAFSGSFLSVYTSDPALVAFAIPSLRIIVLATLVMAISTVVFNGVVGTGNTLVNLTMEIGCVGAYLVYCYFVIYRWQSPLFWCWGSEFVYWISLLVASSIYMRSGRWKGKLV